MNCKSIYLSSSFLSIVSLQYLRVNPSSFHPSNVLYYSNAGARIRCIFTETFRERLQKIDPLEGNTPKTIAFFQTINWDSFSQYPIGLSTADVITVIRNAGGVKASLFVPEKAFELLIKQQLQLLREPSLNVAEMVTFSSSTERLSVCYKIQSIVTSFSLLGLSWVSSCYCSIRAQRAFSF